MACLCSSTTQAVVRELKTIFPRFGIPEILVTDNGLQFSSSEFQVFAKSWSFNHVTTSPRYTHSNGKAENAVRTVKRLFEKCKETGVSEFQALLDWRNTPSEGMDTSTAQRLMGLRCRTLLSLLRPSYPIRGDGNRSFRLHSGRFAYTIKVVSPTMKFQVFQCRMKDYIYMRKCGHLPSAWVLLVRSVTW